MIRMSVLCSHLKRETTQLRMGMVSATTEKEKTMRLINYFELKQKLLEERKKIQRMSGETTFGQATIHGIRIALRLMDQCSPQGEVMPVAVPSLRAERVPNLVTWYTSDGKPVRTMQLGYKCSHCGDDSVKNYCPNCGAKMDGDNDG